MASNEGSPPLAALDAYVERQMRRLRIPGVALAVVAGDRIVYARGYGRARPGGDAPTPQTPFALGSTTKSFTALAAMQLVEAGQLDLDAPVQRYLPWFRVADPAASARITVRHLLTQTSGISMRAGTVYLADLDERPDAAERQVRGLATLALSHPVGATFQYCNLNYTVLGLVIAAASGQPYAAYLHEHILAPLAMHHTYTSRAAAADHGLATGHRLWFGVPVPATGPVVSAGALAAGGLISTAEDMARYLIAQLNGGRCGAAAILSPAGIAELHRPAAIQHMLGSAVTAYGMGWFVDAVGETTLISHGGNVPDFSSFIGLLPERQIGVVLLANADHGLPFILMEVGAGLAAILAGQQPPPIQFGRIPSALAALPLLPLAQLAGAAVTLAQLHRRRAARPRRTPEIGQPAVRGGAAAGRTRRLLLPLLPQLSLAALLAYLSATGLLRYLHLYMPDVAWTARISGGFAGIWALVRTWLLLRERS